MGVERKGFNESFVGNEYSRPPLRREVEIMEKGI